MARKENTAVLSCDCKDAEQDKLYGAGKRLHNLGFTKGKDNGKAYCTVCSIANRVSKISFKRTNPITAPVGIFEKDLFFTRKSKPSAGAFKSKVVIPVKK